MQQLRFYHEDERILSAPLLVLTGLSVVITWTALATGQVELLLAVAGLWMRTMTAPSVFEAPFVAWADERLRGPAAVAIDIKRRARRAWPSLKKAVSVAMASNVACWLVLVGCDALGGPWRAALSVIPPGGLAVLAAISAWVLMTGTAVLTVGSVVMWLSSVVVDHDLAESPVITGAEIATRMRAIEGTLSLCAWSIAVALMIAVSVPHAAAALRSVLPG